MKVGRSEDKVEAKLKLSKIGRRKPLSVNLDAQLAPCALRFNLEHGLLSH